MARANPGLVAYKVQSSAYKYSWALILLSLPFAVLLFFVLGLVAMGISH